jgi:hypothetical protein
MNTERGIQLTANGRNRERVLEEAVACFGALLAAISFNGDEDLAEINIARSTALLAELHKYKAVMRELRKQYDQLEAAG